MEEEEGRGRIKKVGLGMKKAIFLAYLMVMTLFSETTFLPAICFLRSIWCAGFQSTHRVVYFWTDTCIREN